MDPNAIHVNEHICREKQSQNSRRYSQAKERLEGHYGRNSGINHLFSKCCNQIFFNIFVKNFNPDIIVTSHVVYQVLNEALLGTNQQLPTFPVHVEPGFIPT